jgi:hypothetical protein
MILMSEIININLVKFLMLHDLPFYLPINCQTSTYLSPTNLPTHLLTYYVLVYLCTINYQP